MSELIIKPSLFNRMHLDSSVSAIDAFFNLGKALPSPAGYAMTKHAYVIDAPGLGMF